MSTADRYAISRDQLAALVAGLRQAGVEVVAPVELAPGRSEYRPIQSLEQARLDGPLPRLSLKALFLPPVEPLLAWRYYGGGVTLGPASEEFLPRVVLGAHPCDCAALEIVDRVMGWDEPDELWFGRRQATTIISLACTRHGKSCFCSAVRLGCGTTRGADLFLELAGENLLGEVMTDKVRALLTEHGVELSDATVERPAPAPVEEPEPISVDSVREWLESCFEHPIWSELALPCHGCGACAAVCPTCHCFDINDEPEGVTHGVRRRSWDTCQSELFTVHASGHNPRPHQGTRLRQRIMHKLAIYPSRFDEILCTGCGRCVLVCPAGIDLPEILARITRMAAGQEAGGET
jgi:ferredoxin